MSFQTSIEAELEQLKKESQYRYLEPDSGLSFVHNDYLGLSGHEGVVKAGNEAARLFGTGSRGSRLLGGQSRLVEQTERQIARFFEAPSALLFSSGYLANLAAIAALAPFANVIYSDEYNHASLVDGIRLSGKPKKIVPHLSWGTAEFEAGNKLCVSESLFSMDGDLLNSETIAEKKNTFWLIDEAHAAGVFRESGRGLFEKIDWDRTAKVVTFGKAFGVAGAVVLSSAWLREWMINQSRSFIYTTAPAPSVVAMIGAALKVVENEGWRRESLWARAETFRARLADLPGTPIPVARAKWAKRSPIIPFHLSGNARVLRFCQNMRDWGFNLRAIRYPTVARGAERVRISLSLSVSDENTERLADILEKLWMEFLSREPIPE